MLVEIGAAMVHRGGYFVLVVEQGVELPTMVQGVFETRYSGDSLGWDAGMKIQDALRGLSAKEP